jgi:ABC-2 type transport system ATP-binding protein
VQVETVGPNALRLEVTGSVRTVLAALAGKPVVALTSREPSLEEIFLHHYDSSDGRAPG